MQQAKVVIVGASGYSGEELIRLLSQHPHAELVGITSRQAVGQPLATVYPRFAGTRYAALEFIDSTTEAILATGPGIVFLALPHGVATAFALPLIHAGLKVLDLSADFRIKDLNAYAEYYGEAHHAPHLAAMSVYGLPEVYRKEIAEAQLIACPGCYPTSMLLPLLPLVRQKLIQNNSICVFSMSGVSGAGRNAKVDYLFAECNESARAYSVPKHRHLAEVEQELGFAAGYPVKINFTPHLIPVNRGIHTTIYATPAEGVIASDFNAAYRAAYGEAKFVRLLGDKGILPDTKNVVGTNFLDLAWRLDPRTGRLVLLSAEDNLTKGAAGQGVQCLNILCGWPEESGLL